jgi:hypothetical protein
MAELDTLKSYLIGLGFAVDIASYRKMNQLLDQQKKMILNSTGVMSNAYVQAGKTIAGILIGVGAATVTLMDKVAKADLGYDLFGMRMYMTADAAKKVKIAVDALGYSMEEIAWNPELKKRFDELIELQGGLQKKLGPDYKQTMREIRDIRFEFTKMRVEGEYMMQVFVSQLMKKLGISARDVHEALKKFNDWLVANMVPAMEKLAELFGNIWDIVLMLGPSLSGLGKNFSEFMKTISIGSEHAEFLDWAGATAYVLSGMLSTVIFLVRNMILLARAAKDVATGDFKDLARVWDDSVQSWKDYQDSIDLEKRGTEKLQKSGDRARLGTPRPQRGTVSPGVSKFKDLLSKYFPGQENVAAAVMKAESGNDPNAHNPGGGGTGAFGLFQIRGQLHRDALMKAGIIKSDKDLFDPEKNFQAARFLYNQSGWRPWDASKPTWSRELAAGTTTNNVTVNVTQPGASAEEIARAATKKLEELEQRKRARQIRELAGVYG